MLRQVCCLGSGTHGLNEDLGRHRVKSREGRL